MMWSGFVVGYFGHAADRAEHVQFVVDDERVRVFGPADGHLLE